MKLLTFIIVGAGPTGVEFTAALAELINGPLRKDFPRLSFEKVKIYLLEAMDRPLSMLDKSLSEYTIKILQQKGVQFLNHSMVTEISPTGVQISEGDFLPAKTVVWNAGIAGSANNQLLGVPLAKNNFIKVEPTLQISGHENVFAAGDISIIEKNENKLPPMAPVAKQQGRLCAENIIRLINNDSPQNFVYNNKGAMITIGRSTAVANIFKANFKGFFAWIIWIFIHILELIGFRNKLLVMVNWAVDYLFFEKVVRLIMPQCCQNIDVASCHYKNKDFT